MTLILAGSPGSHLRVEQQVAAGHVDGIMLMSMHGADPLPAVLARMGVPMVTHGRTAMLEDLPYVDNDNVGGATQAVRYLLAQGRRRIATISGPLDMIPAQERLTGYRETLRDTGRRSIVAVGDSPGSPAPTACASCWTTIRRWTSSSPPTI